MAEEIARDVWRLRQLSPHALLEAETNCYVVRTHNGAVVVDPPTPEAEALDEIDAVLHSRGLELVGIIVTHGHVDHIGGVAGLQARRPDAWLGGHPLARREFERGGRNLPFEEGRWRSLDEGDQVGAFEVLHTPGHKSDHIALWRPDDRLLIVGDTVAGEGTVIISPPDGDMAEYLHTLRELRELYPETIAPGHGPIIHDPVALLDHYIAHRRRREAALLAVLTGEPQSLRRLVEQVYTDVPPHLHGLAGHSLLAHLIKLEQEGRAAEREGGWRLAPMGAET